MNRPTIESLNSATKIIRARAYIRVSHVGKARQGSLLSDSMQLAEARRYADYMGFEFDEEASRSGADLDVSGFRKKWRDRPGLMRLYEDAKRHQFDVLIFYKISRLARNVKEALDLIEEFEKLGIAFHFVAEKIDSTSAQGRFLRNVLLSAAEMQSEDSSAFLKSTCERRAREGRLHGGALPAWLKREDQGGIGVIPEQKTAFRRMVELRCSGLGYVKIARKMNEEGLRTARGCYWTDGSTYKYLQPSWIRTMLGHGMFNRGKSEAIEIPNAFPPILDIEEADRLLALQKLYSEDYGRKPVGGLDWMVSKRRKRGRYSASATHLLSSLVFCPACGSRMVAFQRDNSCCRSTIFSYRCPNGTTRPDLHQKGLLSINARSLDDAVMRVVRSVLALPPDSLPRKTTKLPRQELATLQEKIDRILSLHLDGKIEEGDFKRKYTELVLEKEQLLEHSEDLETELGLQMRELATRETLTTEELRQLVLMLVDRIEAPVTMPGITIREGLKTLRRLARITLKFPTTDGATEFISGIYLDEFKRERRAVALNGLKKGELTQLVTD